MCGPKNSAGTEVLDKEHIQLDATITELGFGSKEFMDFITKVSVVYEEKVPDNQRVSLKTEIATLIQDPDKTIEEIISGLSRISICYDLNLKPTQTLKPDSTHTELVIESGWQLRRIANHSTFSIVCPDMSGRTAWFYPTIEELSSKLQNEPNESPGIWELLPSSLFPSCPQDLISVIKNTLEKNNTTRDSLSSPFNIFTFSTSFLGALIGSEYPSSRLYMLDPIAPDLTLPFKTKEGSEKLAVDTFIHNMGQLVNIPESLTDTVQKSSQSKALVSALKDGIDDKTFTAWTKLLQTYGVLGTSVTQFLAILTLSFKQFFGSQAAIKISADVGATREFASGLYAQFDDEAIRGIGGFSVKEGSSFNTITINHGLKHLDLPKHRVAIELLQKALYPPKTVVCTTP